MQTGQVVIFIFDSMEKIIPVSPPNCGWIEVRLSEQEIDHLWKCIETSEKKDIKKILAGNISESYTIKDIDDYFFNNVIIPVGRSFENEFCSISSKIPTNKAHSLFLKDLWVNYQRKNEFNPIHLHTGVYSFVVWLKIPTDSNEENQKKIALDSSCPSIGVFEFVYTNILGGIEQQKYYLNKNYEGTMIFFPSDLRHQVYPFYDSDELRISISGNILLDSESHYDTN